MSSGISRKQSEVERQDLKKHLEGAPGEFCSLEQLFRWWTDENLLTAKGSLLVDLLKERVNNGQDIP